MSLLRTFSILRRESGPGLTDERVPCGPVGGAVGKGRTSVTTRHPDVHILVVERVGFRQVAEHVVVGSRGRGAVLAETWKKNRLQNEGII